jgi:hypothetical protein
MILGVVWLVLIVAGALVMDRYAGTAGAAPPAPAKWPEESLVPRDSAHPTLIMFVHPHCPCSSASIGELERLMARYQGRCKAQVLFLNPPAMGPGWTTTDLWRQAAAIPGVTVTNDDGGREAGIFHAETSGQTLLYERDGTLMFQGGITIARGHRGDNPGSDALKALLGHQLSTPVKTSTFGCSLCGTDRAPAPMP